MEGDDTAPIVVVDLDETTLEEVFFLVEEATSPPPVPVPAFFRNCLERKRRLFGILSYDFLYRTLIDYPLSTAET